jgi:ABC-type transport system involved in cytochrome bd biosynthesis fused ATPase/permease subunit
LRHNLKLGHPEADEAELEPGLEAGLEAALKATGLDQTGLSLGDWTGEDGRPLSGGEARRVALIRTVLAGTPAVLLDEPFRGLDADTIAKVRTWLEPQLRGRTLITLDHADEHSLGRDGVFLIADGGLRKIAGKH